MAGTNILFFLIVIAMASLPDGQALDGPPHNKVVVCFVNMLQRNFDINNLDPSLCTHLVYLTATFDELNTAIKSYQSRLDRDNGKNGYIRMLTLKKRYPHLKVTLAIDGIGSLKFSLMTVDPEKRAKFVKNVMIFLENYKFDGLDFLWVYTHGDNGRPQDKVNYVSLVKELKEAFEPKGYILTALISATKTNMESLYDLSNLSQYLDFILLMYFHEHDYHNLDRVAESIAQLKGLNDVDEFSVDFIIKYMLAHGMSPSKMVLVLTMGGNNFVLRNTETKEVIFGQTPVYYEHPMKYNEICMELTNKTTTWTEYWDEKSATPYMRDTARIISYENSRSIATKVKMAIDYNLAGLLVNSMDMDDFQGSCRPDVDTYVDIIDRFHKMTEDPVMRFVVRKSNLPDGSHQEVLNKRYGYTIDNGKLNLHLPEREFTNCPLMRTINEAIVLAIEEKKIMEVMKEVAKDNLIGDEDEDIQVLELCNCEL